MAKEETSKPKRNLKFYGLVAVVVLVLAAGGAFAYKEYDQLKDENARLSDPQASAQAETDRLKQQVAALIDVPADEEPTIASVVDVDKLRNQAFFAKAQNGDKVLMYQQAKRAILYRPSENKIIEVAPINIGSETSQPSGGTENQ